MKAKDEMDYLIREGTSADCQAIYDLICDMEETELPYKLSLHVSQAGS